MKEFDKMEPRKLMIKLMTGIMIGTFVSIGSAHAQNLWDDLCPEPKEYIATAPADLAQVQSDIDRFNLCVKRAELLASLDEIIRKRLGKEDLRNAKMSLPEVPDLPHATTTDEIAKMMQQLAMEQQRPQASQSPDMPVDNDKWYIKKMWGQAGQLKVQLSRQDGLIMTVSKGDVLPNGATVENITLNDVVLNINGKNKNLEWMEADLNEFNQ